MALASSLVSYLDSGLLVVLLLQGSYGKLDVRVGEQELKSVGQVDSMSQREVARLPTRQLERFVRAPRDVKQLNLVVKTAVVGAADIALVVVVVADIVLVGVEVVVVVVDNIVLVEGVDDTAAMTGIVDLAEGDFAAYKLAVAAAAAMEVMAWAFQIELLMYVDLDIGELMVAVHTCSSKALR